MTTSQRRFIATRFQLLTVVTLVACAWVAGAMAAPASTSPATTAQIGKAASSPATAASTEPNPELIKSTTAPNPDWQTITLHRHGASGKQVAVTFGIPFPPGMLQDARNVHILDEHGNKLPAHITPSLHWYVGARGIRAVRVQMHVELAGDTRTLHFALGAPDAGSEVTGWPYVDGLVVNADGIRVPGVLATLSAQWMSTSLIAGPQLASTKPTAYDRYESTQFEWARKLPRDEGSAWLFDRPTTLFQAYVRTGQLDYLAAATESYRFYMSHLHRTGAPGWPLCGGGWSLGKVNVCDPKYVYIEPILLALGLTGDDSEHDDALISRMVGEWDTGGWNVAAGPYTHPDQWFTEREAGLALLSIVSAYELTGEQRYLEDINRHVGWLYDHQQNNPDGLGMDGSWRNSWDKHEGNTYNAATDTRGSSPWMTQNIIDGLWHAWLVTGDRRIPVMITDFGRYLEQYGWIDPQTLRTAGKDWRDPCSGPEGQISWYWSSAHATPAQLIAIENSDGWYSDAHNVELTLPIAAARYFTTDPQLQHALDRRLKLLTSSYDPSCAKNSSTPRRFNWNNRGTGAVQWLLRQPAGSGAVPGIAHKEKP